MEPTWLDAAAALFLGAACPGCGAPAASLCGDCLDHLTRAEPFVVAAGASVPVVAAARYEDVWRRLLVAYKERQAWGLGAGLGRVLAVAVASALVEARVVTGTVLIVPMPSQPASVRDRGLDTTRLLARTAARALRASGLDARVDACLRHRRVVADHQG